MTLGDILKRLPSDARDLPVVLTDGEGWTNVNARLVDGRIEISADTSRPFASDGCPPWKPLQARVREALITRCEECRSYAPMVLPEVLEYFACEKTGDWSGWAIGNEQEEEHGEAETERA